MIYQCPECVTINLYRDKLNHDMTTQSSIEYFVCKCDTCLTEETNKGYNQNE